MPTKSYYSLDIFFIFGSMKRFFFYSFFFGIFCSPFNTLAIAIGVQILPAVPLFFLLKNYIITANTHTNKYFEDTTSDQNSSSQ